MYSGLYLLHSKHFKDDIVKFGMSMRLEYRWNDYQIPDKKYYSQYILSNKNKYQILNIEADILNLTKEFQINDEDIEWRNLNLSSFDELIINYLNKNKINYRVLRGNRVIMKKCVSNNYYSTNRTDELRKLINYSFKLNRFGQQDAYNKFNNILNLKKYWGIMIAPTGWGKTLMHLIFMGLFIKKYNKSVILLTKKKDLLNDINSSIYERIEKLKNSNLFPNVDFNIFNMTENFDFDNFNNLDLPKIIIINIDKLINKSKKNTDPFYKIKKINWTNIDFMIFDEVHHIGANKTYEIMEYLKNKIRFCIGSSATPVRENYENQNNIRKLFNNKNDDDEFRTLDKSDLNIFHEISYLDAWKNNIILKVNPHLICLENVGIEEINNRIVYKYNSDNIKILKDEIVKSLNSSFRKKIILYTNNRNSALNWYENFLSDDRFSNQKKFIAFSTQSSEIEGSYDYLINKKLESLNILNKVKNGIEDFKKEENNSMLFVVHKATEGFDDSLVDICVNLDPIIKRSILLELQKIGRIVRIKEGKSSGIYITPIICSSKEEYLENISDFMVNYIKSITLPISNNSNENRLLDISYITEIYKKFKITSIENIDSEELFSVVASKTNKNLTIEQAMNIIKNNNIKNKNEYFELCKNDPRLPMDPEILFKDQFKSWIEYLGIQRIFYDINTCRKMASIYLKQNNLRNKMNIDTIIKILTKLDDKFPPYGLWIEYYNINNINQIIKIPSKKNNLSNII